MKRFTFCGWRRASTPSTTMRPEVGRTRLVMQPRVVLLPAPLGPSRPNVSPASTANEIPRTASTAGVFRVPGYVFLRSSTTRTGGIARAILSRHEGAVAYDHAALLHDRPHRRNPHAHQIEEAGRPEDHRI